MVYIDKNGARELVEKHRSLFEKIASEGEFESTIVKMVNRAYFVILTVKIVLLGLVWWALASLDPAYGIFYLLLTAMIQAKLVLDNDFACTAESILSAATEAGIGVEQEPETDDKNLEISRTECKSTNENKEAVKDSKSS